MGGSNLDGNNMMVACIDRIKKLELNLTRGHTQAEQLTCYSAEYCSDVCIPYVFIII